MSDGTCQKKPETPLAILYLIRVFHDDLNLRLLILLSIYQLFLGAYYGSPCKETYLARMCISKVPAGRKYRMMQYQNMLRVSNDQRGPTVGKKKYHLTSDFYRCPFLCRLCRPALLLVQLPAPLGQTKEPGMLAFDNTGNELMRASSPWGCLGTSVHMRQMWYESTRGGSQFTVNTAELRYLLIWSNSTRPLPTARANFTRLFSHTLTLV